MRPLSSKGHVIVVSMFPPRPSATALVMRNLLAQFDPHSYTVATIPVPVYNKYTETIQDADVHYLTPGIAFSTRLNQILQSRLHRVAAARLVQLIENTKPAAIVGVYPDELHLALTFEAARRTQIPWLVYFHDLIAEQVTEPGKVESARRLQEQVFAEANSVFVLNQGMQEFYQNTYNYRFKKLEHGYPETLPDALPAIQAEKTVFWGGSVYSWTAKVVKRYAQAAQTLGFPMEIATAQTRKSLEAVGLFEFPNVHSSYYGRRVEYLETLSHQGVLLSGLEWPDESALSEAELATAFSTKTIEYMASGRPILVHCPEHYYLARFFKEHGCGLVISERSGTQLVDGMRFLMQDTAEVETMRQNALRTMRTFALPQLAASFSQEIDRIAAGAALPSQAALS